MSVKKADQVGADEASLEVDSKDRVTRYRNEF